jgi:hypothetical protein
VYKRQIKKRLSRPAYEKCSLETVKIIQENEVECDKALDYAKTNRKLFFHLSKKIIEKGIYLTISDIHLAPDDVFHDIIKNKNIRIKYINDELKKLCINSALDKVSIFLATYDVEFLQRCNYYVNNMIVDLFERSKIENLRYIIDKNIIFPKKKVAINIKTFENLISGKKINNDNAICYNESIFSDIIFYIAKTNDDNQWERIMLAFKFYKGNKFHILIKKICDYNKIELLIKVFKYIIEEKNADVWGYSIDNTTKTIKNSGNIFKRICKTGNITLIGIAMKSKSLSSELIQANIDDLSYKLE